MGAVNLAQDCGGLTGVLPLLIVAIRVVPYVGKACREIIGEEHRRNPIETVRLQIGRETQRAERIGIQARVVRINQCASSRESKGSGQQHRGTDGVDLVESEQVRSAGVRPAGTGIGEVLEAIERSAAAPLLRVLSAQQILLVKAVVNLHIE